jgi:hypothetical protein
MVYIAYQVLDVHIAHLPMGIQMGFCLVVFIYAELYIYNIS